MTGFLGSYNRLTSAYEPPADASTWGALVHRHQLRIATHGVTVVVGRADDGIGHGEDEELEEIDDGST